MLHRERAVNGHSIDVVDSHGRRKKKSIAMRQAILEPWLQFS